MKIFSFALLFFVMSATFSQDKSSNLPYHQIPDYPEDYTAGNVIARMIDGLGYRYYWATKDLTDKDLKYKISEDSRATRSTLEHICGLSQAILNAPQNLANIRPDPWAEMTFDELRQRTLENLKKASDLFLGKTDKEIAEMKVIFQRGESKSEFSFWHLLNGQIADALYHTGQIVSFRRASGNPIQKGVNVFMGKTKE